MNAPTMEAHIVGGDADNVFVGPKEAPEAIPRADIKDIDYPGDGATIAGAILSVYGAANIAVGLPLCHDKPAVFCTGVFTPLAAGVPILIWGIATHASAVSAARTSPHETSSRFFVTPVVGTDKGQPSGAVIAGVF